MSAVTRSAKKALLWLGVLLTGLSATLAVGVVTNKTEWTPALALDLAGGRQIILQAVTTDGSTVTQSDLNQAVEIIRRRVDASGVAEAEIATAGSDSIVVSLPGNPDESMLDLVRQSAQLQFRPVLAIGDPGPVTTNPTPTPSASPSASPETSGEATASDAPEASASPSAAPSNATSAEEPTTSNETGDTATTPDNPSSFDWITPEIEEAFYALDCFDPLNRAGAPMGDPNAAHVACSQDGFYKYLLGPVELSGSDVATANAGPQLSATGSFTGQYEVRLEFTADATARFDATTVRLLNLESPRNQFAILLDGVVISAPSVQSRIPDGNPSITGGFTELSSQQLANQLKFGALPMSLVVQSELQVPATLGADQLQMSLIAGAIGLGLVVLYMLLQYRALGLVTVASLVIAGVLTLVVFSLLSWGMGLRLSLAGVAGMIIGIGVTADSFIVYFERIKDELRDGRSIQSAVEHGWRRARRTIIVSDAVSMLAAVVLYALAVGGVRGFAFTLGLTTVMDLLVVLLFTYPVMELLARTKYFGEGRRWSGLEPESVGRESLYQGAGRVRQPRAARTATSAAESGDEGEKLTLAERKARARAAAAASNPEEN